MSTNTRKDYKVSRNTKIYEEYLKTDTSYNKLARKYDLTPQRIQTIIESVRKKGLDQQLSSKTTREERMQYRDLDATMREKGMFDIAKDMFTNLYMHDKQNEGLKNQMQSIGHLKITLQSIADNQKDTKKKKALYSEAAALLEEGLVIVKKGIANGEITKGYGATHLVHMASLNLRLATVESKKDTALLEKALKQLNLALKDIDGSEAHKAWPMGIKGMVLHALDKNDEALKTLTEAQVKLYEGYKEELKEKEHVRIKLNVWTTGIFLNMAIIYANTGRNILAEFYANAVIHAEDLDGVLHQRKKEAKQLLMKL